MNNITLFAGMQAPGAGASAVAARIVTVGKYVCVGTDSRAVGHAAAEPPRRLVGPRPYSGKRLMRPETFEQRPREPSSKKMTTF